MRQLSLSESVVPALNASRAHFDGNLRLIGFTCTDGLQLLGSHVGGVLLLDGAQLGTSEIALDGTLLKVGSDFVGQNGLLCHGALRLLNASVGGALRLEGAHIYNPGGVAVDARNLTVGTLANCCDGFTAEGTVRFCTAHTDGR